MQGYWTEVEQVDKRLSIQIFMKHYIPSDQMGNAWVPFDTPYLTRGQRTKWLHRDTRLCTIGSCFARNFARWIRQQGSTISSVEWGLHYNSATIRGEFECAAGIPRIEVIWEQKSAGITKFHDAKRHPVSAPDRTQLALKTQEIAYKGAQALRHSDAFIITLGLSEIWEQKVNLHWEVLNRAPLSDHQASGRPPVRSRFQSISEIIKDLSRVVEIIESTGPGRPIVFTVSPVPLKTTGAPYDARIANTRSKSLLVTALHEFLDMNEKDYPNLTYYPAYEQFLYFDQDLPIWQSDGRHILAKKVDSVCRSFCSLFAMQPQAYPSLPHFEVPQV